MGNKKSNSFDLGGRGWLITILSLFFMFFYMGLTNDSLNQMVPTFAGIFGVEQAVIYSFSTISTIVCIFAAMAWGAWLKLKQGKFIWVFGLFWIAAFAIFWSFAKTPVMYAIGYIGCQVGVSGAGLGQGAVVAQWFPRKRGLVMGWCTAGFPLSAALTSHVTNLFIGLGDFRGFYWAFAAGLVIIAILIMLTLKNYPEQLNCYPDNDKNLSKEALQAEFDRGIEYLKTSKWSSYKKVLSCGRVWLIVVSMGSLAFFSIGTMSNFFNKFLQQGYQIPEILTMITIAGVVAIPGSIFIGWLDVRIGTRKAAIITFICGIVAIILHVTPVHALHYVALPLMSVCLGGASNFSVSLTSAIWGRYDYQNVVRVTSPAGSIFSGLGISVIGIVGTTAGYIVAYIATGILLVIGLILFLFIKIEPIDEDVARVMAELSGQGAKPAKEDVSAQ